MATLPDGTPVGAAAARSMRSAVDRAVAVVRPGDPALAALLETEGFEPLPFARADEGMGASLAFGVAAVPEAAGWLVALADMPFVRPGTVQAVARRLRDGGRIVVPCHRGKRGHPVGFGRLHLGELLGLTGDQGGRSLLERGPDDVELVETEDHGVLIDIDSRSDLECR